ARAPDAAHGGRDRAVRRTPAQHQDLGALSGRAVRVVHHGVRHVDPVHLGLAGAHHVVVVGRVVADVAGAVLLLDAADAVLQAGRAGDGPRAGERALVALERPEHLGAVGQRVVRAAGE